MTTISTITTMNSSKTNLDEAHKKWDAMMADPERDYGRLDLERLQDMAHEIRRESTKGVSCTDLKIKYNYMFSNSPTLFEKCRDEKFPLNMIDKLLEHMVKARENEITTTELVKGIYTWQTSGTAQGPQTTQQLTPVQ